MVNGNTQHADACSELRPKSGEQAGPTTAERYPPRTEQSCVGSFDSHRGGIARDQGVIVCVGGAAHQAVRAAVVHLHRERSRPTWFEFSGQFEISG